MIHIQSLKLFEGEQLLKTLLQMVHIPAPSAALISSVKVQVPHPNMQKSKGTSKWWRQWFKRNSYQLTNCSTDYQFKTWDSQDKSHEMNMLSSLHQICLTGLIVMKSWEEGGMGKPPSWKPLALAKEIILPGGRNLEPSIQVPTNKGNLIPSHHQPKIAKMVVPQYQNNHWYSVTYENISCIFWLMSVILLWCLI